MTNSNNPRELLKRAQAAEAQMEVLTQLRARVASRSVEVGRRAQASQYSAELAAIRHEAEQDGFAGTLDEKLAHYTAQLSVLSRFLSQD